MGYFDIIKDKGSSYSGVGSKAVKTQVKKRGQLRDAAGSGAGGAKRSPRPTKRAKGKLRKRKKRIKSIFDRLKRP